MNKDKIIDSLIEDIEYIREFTREVWIIKQLEKMRIKLLQLQMENMPEGIEPYRYSS